jgi:hypothetical protein
MKNIAPKTEYTGVIRIGDKDIPCAVLYPDSENPIRVIVQRQIVGLLTGNKKGGFERYLKASNLQSYVPEKFKIKPLVECTHNFKIKGLMAQGFEGDDLIDLCQMYMNARKDGILFDNQLQLAAKSEIIVFAFAKTGVNALIDEVTGYQYVRDRFALNKLLDKYIKDEANKWVKKFPDEFYKQIFILNNWEYNPTTVKRPSCIGNWTKKIIYSQFPKGTLARLEDKNPLTEKGYRKHKHHQFLTEDIGNPALEQYITNVIFLMRSVTNWKLFLRAFATAMGQTEIPFED